MFAYINIIYVWCVDVAILQMHSLKFEDCIVWLKCVFVCITHQIYFLWLPGNLNFGYPRIKTILWHKIKVRTIKNYYFKHRSFFDCKRVMPIQRKEGNSLRIMLAYCFILLLQLMKDSTHFLVDNFWNHSRHYWS